MDDFGYSSNLADQFGLQYSGHRLYDEGSYATELGADYIWINIGSAFNFTTNSGSLATIHPCLKDLDKDGVIDILDPEPLDPAISAFVSEADAGLCAHRYSTEGWDFSENYHLLTNTLHPPLRRRLRTTLWKTATLSASQLSTLTLTPTTMVI